MKPIYDLQYRQRFISAFESGRFPSMKAVLDSFRSRYDKCPTIRTAQEWVKGHRIGSKAQELESRIDEEVMETFVKAGMPRMKAVKKTISLINATTVAAKAKGLDMYWDLSGLKKLKDQGKQGDSITNNTIFVIPANGFEPRMPERKEVSKQ